jgi:RimJ/RimL family protein N-acetyltransferase
VSRIEARWTTPLGSLAVFEPSTQALAHAAEGLARFYNEPHNAALLSNTLLFSSDDVIDFWRDAAADGSRAFLFARDGEVVGDGDFRNAVQGAAELAVLIGPRALQGLGLGARFVLMMLRVGFERLALERVFVAIRPANAASLRLFERAGFVRDETPAARSYAEEDDDICMMLARATFFAHHAEVVQAMDVTENSLPRYS